LKTHLHKQQPKKPRSKILLIFDYLCFSYSFIYLTKLIAFSKKHSDSGKSLTAWKLIVENSNWQKNQDILERFPNAKIIKSKRARFKIVGNKYRLIIEVNYRDKMLLIHLISEFENKLWDLPEVDPIEMIGIRMDDFGYYASTLAKIYGDRGTISSCNFNLPTELKLSKGSE